MSSKISTTTIDNTLNDASQVQGLTASRLAVSGNANTTNFNVTDAGAIEKSLTFATANADSTAKNAADLIGMTGNLAALAFQSAQKSTSQALDNLTQASARSTADVQAAYDKASNSGINVMQLALIGAVLFGVAIFAGVFKGK